MIVQPLVRGYALLARGVIRFWAEVKRTLVKLCQVDVISAGLRNPQQISWQFLIDPARQTTQKSVSSCSVSELMIEELSIEIPYSLAIHAPTGFASVRLEG